MRQLPDGRWHWEPKHCRPLCQVCESDADLYCYTYNGEAFWFCSLEHAERYADDNELGISHWQRELYDKPYNGAAWGYSLYDMDDRECHNWGDYDCCDDAEDYADDADDNCEE